ncbi:hypothetical protein SK128_020749 [Halocaridina rubra]|uniref:Uncharacterized protein n=1 Tax=Halocaridina rubra TaxID=373956 RepID=A0AAN8WXH7_HALRR
MSSAWLNTSFNPFGLQTYPASPTLNERSAVHLGYLPHLVSTYVNPASGGNTPHPFIDLQHHPGSPNSLLSSQAPPQHKAFSPQHTRNSMPSTLFDPLNIFQPKKPSHPLLHRRTFMKKGQVTSSTTEAPPPIIYFPEGGSGSCEDFSPSGFNTYSFISFLFSVANLAGLIANNVNNNLNNNNNNDNDNNNNLGNINVANSNSALNNQNSVNIPAAMGGRKRRFVDFRGDIHSRYYTQCRVFYV